MSDNNIQFDTDQKQFQDRADSGRSRGLIGWLIKHDIAKDEQSANKIMLAVLILNIVLIYFVISYFL